MADRRETFGLCHGAGAGATPAAQPEAGAAARAGVGAQGHSLYSQGLSFLEPGGLTAGPARRAGSVGRRGTTGTVADDTVRRHRLSLTPCVDRAVCQRWTLARI
jgi:hypothetical protein